MYSFHWGDYDMSWEETNQFQNIIILWTLKRSTVKRDTSILHFRCRAAMHVWLLQASFTLSRADSLANASECPFWNGWMVKVELGKAWKKNCRGKRSCKTFKFVELWGNLDPFARPNFSDGLLEFCLEVPWFRKSGQWLYQIISCDFFLRCKYKFSRFAITWIVLDFLNLLGLTTCVDFFALRWSSKDRTLHVLPLHHIHGVRFWDLWQCETWWCDTSSKQVQNILNSALFNGAAVEVTVFDAEFCLKSQTKTTW